jgi:hypothetical protein
MNLTKVSKFGGLGEDTGPARPRTCRVKNGGVRRQKKIYGTGVWLALIIDKICPTLQRQNTEISKQIFPEKE